MHNRKKPKNNTSGFIGVDWHKGNGKWRARIRQYGVHKTIGYYDTAVEAAQAYDSKAKERGEFAVLNFPDP